tara:strand:+ start:16544 stop:17302 length:759 start_codon:yes stop_codon:yes gene_type:complete
MRLENKVAIITGSANGMGKAEAERFAKEGAKVVIADIVEDLMLKVESSIIENGGEAISIKLDITKESDWKQAISKTIETYGKIDILVNNAGIGLFEMDPLSVDAWDTFMDVNAKGAFLGMKYAIPEMMKNGGGSIVNIVSMSSFVVHPVIHIGYNASKGASRIASKAVAVKYAKDNIRVNAIHPGIMPPMSTSKQSIDPDLIKGYAKMIEDTPMGRRGKVEEVANAALFLASDEASFITGADLVVDGGFTAI